MKNILLLNVGTRNCLVKYFKESLVGNDALVVATDSYVLAPALYEADKHYVTMNYYEEGYWERILEICDMDNIGLVLSLIDPELEVLAKKRNQFEKKGIILNIGEEDVVLTAYDKFQTQEFMKNHGYEWIPTYEDIDKAVLAIKDGSLCYPLIVKPRKGSGSQGVTKVHDFTQLVAACSSIGDYIIQQFIDGQEIGADVYVDLISGEVVSVFLKKKLKMRAGETDKSVSYINYQLIEKIAEFAKEFGLRGVSDLDIFETSDKYYISEINPRFGGGYLHAYEAGENYPKYLINNMNGIVNEVRIAKYEDNLYMMKYFAIKMLKYNGEIE